LAALRRASVSAAERAAPNWLIPKTAEVAGRASEFGRNWPISKTKTKTEAVWDGQPSSWSPPTQRDSRSAKLGSNATYIFATQVMRPSSSSAVGQEGRSGQALGATALPPAAVSPRTVRELSARPVIAYQIASVSIGGWGHEGRSSQRRATHAEPPEATVAANETGIVRCRLTSRRIGDRPRSSAPGRARVLLMLTARARKPSPKR